MAGAGGSLWGAPGPTGGEYRPRPRANTPLSEDLLEVLRGLGDMGASTLRGAVKGTLGLPGDIESLGRMIPGFEGENALPTSEDIGKKSWMPPVNPGQPESPYEGVGEVLGLPGAGTAALKVAKPVVKALRVTERANTPALGAERRGFMRTAGATGAAATGLLGADAMVKALRGTAKGADELHAAKAVPEVKRVPPKKAPKHVSHRVMEKMQEYHKYDALDDPEVWGQAHKPYTPGELIDIGRKDFPGKSDDEILHIYERMLDTEPGVKSGEWGTKTLSKAENEAMGQGRMLADGTWDETDARIVQDIVDGKINPRDYKPGTFDRLDWGNSDYFDHRHTLYGTIDESVPIQKVTKDRPNSMTEAAKEEYFRKLDAKPQSAAPSELGPEHAIMMAASLRERPTKTARLLLKKGMNKHDVWSKTGRELVPGTTNKWMQEISDEPARLNAGPWFKDNGTLNPGWYKLDSILNHPELFEKLPQFKNTKVDIGPMEPGIAGSYNPDIDRIGLNSEYFSTYNKADVIDTILHEIQHPIQRKHGWPEGTSPTATTFTTEQLRGLKTLRGREGPHPEKKQKLLDAIAALKDPHSIYAHTWGEQQAEVPALRRLMDDAARKSVGPSGDYKDLSRGFDIKDFYKLQKELERTYDPPPEMQWQDLQAAIKAFNIGK